ncbi:MAG: SDR family oxidoreductase [Eubacteriales bacterium]|nr:SDR family oxidoreductase [Eubacteriales bacterium]
MRVVVTGSSTGMGKAIAKKYLKEGHQVFGLDQKDATIEHEHYIHYVCDVSDAKSLPEIEDINILVNNAGVQSMENMRDIDVNLRGVMHCTNRYGLQPSIRAILNQASVSAHNGAEFPEYVASKGGVLSYTKWTAKEIAQYGAVANSISFGGVITQLNAPVMQDGKMWDEIMSMTPLKKWATVDEAAEWVYFLTVVNKSMTAQDVIVDNGEMYNHRFVW